MPLPPQPTTTQTSKTKHHTMALPPDAHLWHGSGVVPSLIHPAGTTEHDNNTLSNEAFNGREK